MIRNVIWNFSGACLDEGLSDFVHGDVIDCRLIEGTNCYCEDEAVDKIKALFPDSSKDLTVNWIDTGDYHYMSRLSVAEAGELVLLVLDHHPDMQEPAFGGILSCGGWVRHLLEACPQVEKAVILGISPELKSECGGFGERVEVLDRDSYHTFKSESLAGKKVYLSIDKDVLTREYARTDWDQGTMDLNYLEDIVRQVAKISEIVGIDICGGITSGKGGNAVDFAINRKTDFRLLKLFESISK